MKKISIVFALFMMALGSNAQNINGVINDYAQVTGINLNVITLDNAANFNIGDRILIIKMKGATIDQTNTNTYGDSLSLNDAGLYLFSDIIAKTANDVTLDTFCNIFDTIQHIQMVRVPIYPNPTVTGTLTCTPWNGTIGGILAFATPGTLTMNANIDVSENGFRGGGLQGSTFNCGSNDFFSTFPGPNGQKGEGVAEYIVGQQGGAGKLVNGGGGAYAGNAGAGGGGNAGAGGRGGDQYSGCNPTNKFGIGGHGILPQTHTMFLGGAGGGPQADNSQTVFPGGNGGGIIFIAANTIVGNNNSILSNGGDVATTNDEGSGAGGAGGSIYLMAANYNTNLTVNANGGAGGSNNNTIFTAQCHGPGGGGGGGLIWFSNAGIPAGVTTAINGGDAGLVLNPNSSCFNTTNNGVNGANGTISFNFVPSVAAPLNIDLGPDLPICIGQTITLDAGAGFASYSWDDNSMNQTRNVTNPGTYFVTVLNQIGCIGSDTIDVYLDTSVQANFSFSIDYGCESDSVYFVNNSTGATTYYWDFGDANFSTQSDPLHIYGVQGSFNVTLVAGNPPCFDTITMTVNTAHPIQSVFSATPPDSLCLDGNQIILDATFSQPPTNRTFYWDYGDGNNLTTTNPISVYSFATAGTFTITLAVTDTIGCSDTSATTVIVQDIPAVSFTISDDTICVGEFVYFVDSISPNANTWRWDFGDGSLLANEHNPAHAYAQGGVFNVSLTGSNPFCPDQVADTIITVNDYPLINLGEDKTFCPGINETVTLQNELNSSAIMNWSNGETAPSITVGETGYYWATSSNQGCATVDSIWVKRDCYLNIPNSFTPGGDGLNDFFIPRQLLSSGVTEFSMKIFNRWGEIVYETDQVDGRGWDGKYGGKDQPIGVYVYLIEAKWRNGFKNTFQGNLTLLR